MRWPLDGSLNYYPILQLKLFCLRAREDDEISYIQAYMSLHNEDAAGENSKLMVRRQGEKPKICPDDANEKQREKKEKGYMVNLALPPPLPGLLLPPPHPSVGALGPSSLGRGQSNPGTVSPFTTQKGSQFGQVVPNARTGQCLLR